MFDDNRSPIQLTTQCPHCQTPLQADVGALQRSKGWARCGRCHYLFDAVAHTGIPTLAPVSSGFTDDTPTAAPQAPGMRQAVPQMPQGVKVEPLSNAASKNTSKEPHKEVAAPLVVEPKLGVESLAAAPHVWPTEQVSEPDLEHELDPDKGTSAASLSSDEAQPTPNELPQVPASWRDLSMAMDAVIPTQQPVTDGAVVVTNANAVEPSLEPQPAEDSDVRQSLSQMYDQAAQSSNSAARSEQDLLGTPVVAPALAAEPRSVNFADGNAIDDNKRASPGLRWLSLFTGFVLLLLLGAQVAYLQRDWLVARMPQLQPVAQQVCQQLGCTIDPVQDMSQMRILSSSVMRLQSGELQLDITLENKGELQLDVPHIDVLLTDGTDQVFMMHRVGPADWPKALERLEAGSRYPITVRWPTRDEDAARMVGYRTQLSYD